MSANWQRLEHIFIEARQLPASEQAAFVARACGNDADLRFEAETLLSASDQSGEFLQRPALDRLAEAFAADGLNLRPGRRIGAYTIVRQLGIGGAGEVWRAKDERLDRDVAIKVLLPHLSGDAAKLGRFAEEARAAGSLNHANIVTVHDVGEHEGMPYLVAECLEGRNLRERLKAGPMTVTEALKVAQGVAQGLAAAHERGIVHCDLKPENTFLKSDGGVKLLDFGLARLKLPSAGSTPGADDAALSLVAGTAAYMAPEQARGEAPDPRADLFALGVMLHEMLTGQHPFRGASVLETLQAILTGEPPDLLTANERVPPPVARIVMRLLQKQPEARFQSARDLAWSLAQAAGGEAPHEPEAPRLPAWLRYGVPAAIVAALAIGWWLAGRWSPPPGGELTRFAWQMPEGTRLDSPPAVAPDGRRVAFAATGEGGPRLYLRGLESRQAQAIAGSEGASLPFWSPDGESLGYFRGGQLMTVALPNGAPTPLAPAIAGRGGAWTASGIIVYAPDLVLTGLSRVPAAGGAPEPATLLDQARGETSHWWPVALPDGIHFLYYVRSIDAAHRGIYLARVDRPARTPGTRLFPADSGAALVPRAGSDAVDLVYIVNDRVEARGFDLATLAADAQARTIDLLPAHRNIMNPPLLGAAAGLVAYAETVIPSGNRLASVALDGSDLRYGENLEAHNWPRLSPDGRRLARQRIDESRSQPDVWIEDLERGTAYPVARTLDPDMSPVWSPDGSLVVFSTGHLPGRRGELALNIAAADGTGIVRALPCPGDYCEPTDWSADGSTLLLTVLEGGISNVWAMPAGGESGARPLLAAPFNEMDARYSPDGRWVAYTAHEGERPEVMVSAVGRPPRRLAVSGEGGTQPVWRRDGTQLYFVGLDGRLRSVAVRWRGDGSPEFGLPVRLELPQVGFGHWGTQYDLTPNASRIYFMQPTQDQAPVELQVAINGRALLD